MKKLFAIMLGGRAAGCNIELHDVVFTVAENLEAAQPRLRQKWFGDSKRLHIDAWIELTQVDGFDILLSNEKTTGLTDRMADKMAQQLYFVNFGGYHSGVFNETHQSAFYVAASKNAALQRAKKELCLGLSEQHCDDNLAIDDLFQIDSVDNYTIHLQESTVIKPLKIMAKYIKLEQIVSL